MKTRQILVSVGKCEQCGGDIYMHNTFYRTTKGRVHEDCFDEFSHDYFQAELVEGIEGLLD